MVLVEMAYMPCRSSNGFSDNVNQYDYKIDPDEWRSIYDDDVIAGMLDCVRLAGKTMD